MLDEKWINKIEKDFKIYSQYNVLIYEYYLDNYGWVSSLTEGIPAHFLSIEYWDYDTEDIIVYYNAKISKEIVMVEGINYYRYNNRWDYHHIWWEFI